MRRNEKKIAGGKIYKIFSILFFLVEKLIAQINFIGPVSSGKTNFRPIGEGPLPGFFSICQSATECRIMNKTTDVWSSTTLNQAYIYSAQLVKKTFVTGFASKVLDVSNLKTATDKPVERATVPVKILRCPFTKGYRWICLDGTTGGYFTYDIAKEAKETTFDTSLSAKFGLLNNGNCAIVVENKTIFCALIGSDQKKLIHLDQANAGGLPTYAGNLTIPTNPVGATDHKGILGIFSVDTVKMRISNYSSGVLLYSWDKNEKADAFKTVADMNWGLMIIRSTTKSDIVKTKDGSILKTIKAESSEFSEVDKSFYFVDSSNGNQDSYYQFTLPAPPANCTDYHYGIEKCLKCQTNFTLLQNGTCLKNNTNKTAPGTYINPQNYDILFEETARGMAVMKFTNLTSMTNPQRFEYIKNFTNDTKFSDKFVLTHDRDNTWNVSDFFRFEPMAESISWENGVLPINVVHLRNSENFKGKIGVLTNGNRGNLTVANNTGNNATNNTGNNTANATANATKLRLLVPVASLKPERVLQGSFNPFKNLSLPPYWKPSDGLKTFFRVIFDFMKFVVNLLQVYLIFIKPFGSILRYDKWSSWFASSLQAMQIFLMLGGITGRFGGIIDAMQIEQLKSFQRNFFFDTEINFSESYKRIHRAALLEKFQLAGYTPSPIQETFWEFAILIFSILFQGIGMIVPSLLPISSTFRKGATNSFMIPLVLASVGCIVALIKTSLSNIFGVLSLISSIFLLLYFFGEILNLIRPCESMDMQRMGQREKAVYKNRLLREGSYRCYDIDSLNNFNRNRPLNFFEYFINLLFPIVLFSFIFTGVGSILSIIALLIAKLVLLFMQSSSRKKMLMKNGWGDEVGKEVQDFNSLKTLDTILKLLYCAILLIFIGFLRYSSLAWTQIFTVLGLFLVFSDYIIQFLTLAKRFLGWGDALKRTEKIVKVREERERERRLERGEIRNEEIVQETTERRIVEKSGRNSPRESRRYQDYGESRLPPGGSRSPRPYSPRISNNGNVRRLPPIVRYSKDNRSINGSVSPRIRRSRVNNE